MTDNKSIITSEFINQDSIGLTYELIGKNETYKSVSNDKNIVSYEQNGLLLINSRGIVFWTDSNYLKLTDFENSEVINTALVDLVATNESNLGELKKITNSINNGVDFDVEVFHIKNNNSPFWSRITGKAVVDNQGVLFQYVVSVQVITKENGILDRLKESESTLFSFLMNLQKGILLEDENRKIVAVNKEFCSMFSLEMDPNLIVGLDCNEFDEQNKVYFKNSDQYVLRVKQLLEKKEIVINDELELVDGRFFERTFIPIIKEGINKGRLWSYKDSTINKNYKENLNYEKGKYRRIIANMNIGLLEVDNEDTIILANQSFSEMSGYTIDELIGKKGAELFLDAAAKEKLIEKGIERKVGKSDSYEIVIKNKNGDLKNWLISGAPNYNINGEVIGSIGIHLNITEQKNQEEQLILLSLIAEKNINSVIICDSQGKIEWVNDSFISMSEYTFEEAVGKKPGHLLQGKDSDLEQIDYLRTQIRHGLPFKCELINYKKSGEKYWVYLQGQALYNKEGKILKYFAIEEDITNTINLKSQKEELVNSAAKTNKDLESYAFIASHDLKAPIRSIYSLVTCIKEDNDLNEQTKEYFSIIENKLEKMDHQIEGILEYAKIDKEDFFYEEVNCNEIIKISLENLLIPENIKVLIVKELPILKADRFRLQQLFQNVISNAVNFIEKPKGIVEIDCKEERNTYIFSVKDNGRGVAKENQHQIFNISKYFNNNNRSTGLGLSIAKKIVEICNGSIWIESELGVGTTFFIELKK